MLQNWHILVLGVGVYFAFLLTVGTWVTKTNPSDSRTFRIFWCTLGAPIYYPYLIAEARRKSQALKIFAITDLSGEAKSWNQHRVDFTLWLMATELESAYKLENQARAEKWYYADVQRVTKKSQEQKQAFWQAYGLAKKIGLVTRYSNYGDYAKNQPHQ